ncbi:MAG: lipopolysaccharide biosynthesis protein [Acidobacteriota bacterium]
MHPMLGRIISAMGAGAFGQGVSILIQVGSLPLFLMYWNAERYGTWLMLSAMPAYLSMADIGMVAAAGNRMTMEMAKGQVQMANRVFHSATVFMLLVTGAVAAIAGVVLLSGLTRWPAEQSLAMWLLILTVLVALFSGLSEAIFKASGRYAQGTLLGNLLRLAEWGGALLGLLVWGSFTAVAAGGLAARSLGLLLVMQHARRHSNGLAWGWQHACRDDVREMVRPALSFMVFPLANALTFQGGTLLVGYLLGASAVTAFSAARTVSRVAVQITSVLAHALWVEFSRLFGLARWTELNRVYAHALRTGLLVSIVLSGVFFVLSPWLLARWTHGQVTFIPTLMAVLLVYAAVAGIWHVPRVLLMASNQHVALAPWSLAAAVLMLVGSYGLGAQWGLVGVGVGMLMSEVAIAAISLFLAAGLLHQPDHKQVFAS